MGQSMGRMQKNDVPKLQNQCGIVGDVRMKVIPSTLTFAKVIIKLCAINHYFTACMDKPRILGLHLGWLLTNTG